MKFTRIMLSLALIGTLSLATAEDVVTTDTTVDTTTTTDATTTDTTTDVTTDTTVTVDDEIAAIQAAPAQERVRLMNQFKQRLMSMNEAERSEAITQMQAAMQTTTDATTTATDTATQAMMQTRMRTQTRAQDMQMQVNEDAIQMQNMNQMRVGTQMANLPTNPPVNVAPAVSGGQSMHFNPVAR
jgi:hypothetical protein